MMTSELVGGVGAGTDHLLGKRSAIVQNFALPLKGLSKLSKPPSLTIAQTIAQADLRARVSRKSVVSKTNLDGLRNRGSQVRLLSGALLLGLNAAWIRGRGQLGGADPIRPPRPNRPRLGRPSRRRRSTARELPFAWKAIERGAAVEARFCLAYRVRL